MWCKPDLMLVPGWDNAAMIRAPPPSLAQTHKNRSVPVWKEFSKKGFHRIRLIPGAKLSKFMLRQGTLDLGKCSKNKLEQLFFSFKHQLQKCCCKHQMSVSFVNYFSREHLYTPTRIEELCSEGNEQFEKEKWRIKESLSSQLSSQASGLSQGQLGSI